MRAARAPNAFYGWWMVGLCSVARGFTSPGQTIGISAFIDELIETLGTTRSTVATAYMVGTLTGAIALPFIGRWVDRTGIRRTMLIVSCLFGGAILFASTVQNAVMLAVAFLGLRMLGQGALSLIAVQGVVVWFEERRGFALAVSGIGTLILMSISPLVFAGAISLVGWRMAWVIIAIGLVAVLAPIAWFGIVDRPEELSQLPDGSAADDLKPTRTRSFTVKEALRVPAFWTLSGITLMAGAVATGLTFHNTDLLGERGLTPTQAAAVFIPQMLGGASAGFIVGWMTDRFPARPLMVTSAGLLAIGTLLATWAEPGAKAILFGLVLGLASGSTQATFTALMPKWFGVDHIGAIRGLATTANVGASAVGPLILSLGNDASGSYVPIVTACAIACAVMGVVALMVPTPS